MANVGKNIRLIRKQKNMTQDTLAELLYVSRQTVSNYETGRSNPDIDMLVKIAEVLQTDVNILIFGFPVPLSRKREYIKLGIAAVFLMAFVFLFMRLSSWETVWRRDRFDLGLMFALHLLFRPALYAGDLSFVEDQQTVRKDFCGCVPGDSYSVGHLSDFDHSVLCDASVCKLADDKGF